MDFEELKFVMVFLIGTLIFSNIGIRLRHHDDLSKTAMFIFHIINSALWLALITYTLIEFILVH